MFKMKAAGLSDVGRLRKNNEDSFAVEDSLLVVADGMGGAAAGEIASRIAVDTIIEKLKGIPYTSDDEVAETVRNAVTEADEKIKRETRLNRELDGMGTTIVLAIHFDERLLVANVGDSRAYLITNIVPGPDQSRGSGPSAVDANAQTAILQPVSMDEQKSPGEIRRLSEDHSVVMDLVRSGVITEDEIRTHPLRNRITRCVGSFRGETADVTWHDVNENDILLLCSDGLWELVHEDIIFAVANSSLPMEELCKRLIEAANDAGGTDNITVVAAQFVRE